MLEALPLQESGEEQDEKPTNSFSVLTWAEAGSEKISSKPGLVRVANEPFL